MNIGHEDHLNEKLYVYLDFDVDGEFSVNVNVAPLTSFRISASDRLFLLTILFKVEISSSVYPKSFSTDSDSCALSFIAPTKSKLRM